MYIENVKLGQAVKFCTIILNDLTWYDPEQIKSEICRVIGILNDVNSELDNFFKSLEHENR